MAIDSGVQPFEHLVRAARAAPNAPALVTASRDLTFAQLLDHARKIAAMLRESGVRAGDVVAAQVSGMLAPVFTLMLFHEAAVGCVIPGEVGAERADEVDWVITVEPEPGFPPERTIIVDNNWLARAAAMSSDIEPHAFPSRDALCRIAYSSGTTGAPVGVPLTVRYLDQRTDSAGAAWVRATPFMSMIGIGSVVGLLTLNWCMAHGQTYLCPGTAPESIGIARRAGVAALKGSPAQWAEVVRELARTGQRLERVGVALIAGAVSSRRLEADIVALTSARVVRSYASTEAGPAAVQTAQGSDPLDAGRVVEGVEVQAVDPESGEVLPAGAEGLLRIRREGLPATYCGAARASLRDGWFYPGDVGVISADGRLRLSGRSSEVLNVGGVKVDPAELDSLLHDAALVDDAVAFGFTNQQGITALALAALCPPGTDFTELVQAVTRMTGGVRPEVVHRVDAIQRTPTGKVDRLALAGNLEAAIAAL